MKITLELTDEQYSALCHALQLAPDYCRRQAETWEKRAAETNEDGTPKFIHARDNADCYTKRALHDEELYEMIRG